MEPVNRLKEEQKAKPRKKTSSLVKMLGRFNPDNVLSINSMLNHLPFILFIALLAVLYIANTHYAEKNIREINRLQRDFKELRWELLTTQNELMYRSKQTEVAKAVEEQGLKELTNPPNKIVVKKKDEY